MVFEADTSENLQKHAHLVRLLDRSGLTATDEPTHIFLEWVYTAER